MKRLNELSKLVLLLLFMLALYWGGNYVAYMLTYIFSFVFLCCHVCICHTPLSKKCLQILLQAVILAAQILTDILIIRPLTDMNGISSFVHVLAVAITLVPFLLRQSFVRQERKEDIEIKRIAG